MDKIIYTFECGTYHVFSDEKIIHQCVKLGCDETCKIIDVKRYHCGLKLQCSRGCVQIKENYDSKCYCGSPIVSVKSE